LILIHPEVVAQFMDDRKADLFADFGLAGADRPKPTPALSTLVVAMSRVRESFVSLP